MRLYDYEREEQHAVGMEVTRACAVQALRMVGVDVTGSSLSSRLAREALEVGASQLEPNEYQLALMELAMRL